MDMVKLEVKKPRLNTVGERSCIPGDSNPELVVRYLAGSYSSESVSPAGAASPRHDALFRKRCYGGSW